MTSLLFVPPPKSRMFCPSLRAKNFVEGHQFSVLGEIRAAIEYVLSYWLYRT